MDVATSQQLQDYYDRYRDAEIIFTKNILQTLKIDPRQIYVKCNGGQWPCIINSISFLAAKVIIGSKGGAYAAITRQDVGSVNLRIYFVESDNQPVSFFVTGKVAEITPYMSTQDLVVATLKFTQRPPDVLIEKLGTILDANSNAARRKEERIILNPEVKRRIGLQKEETIVQIDGVPRRCVLRDLSFSGAKVILMGIAKFIQGKTTLIHIRFEDPFEVVNMKGTIVKTDPIQGRQDIIFVAIKFDDATVPMGYKLRINNYLANMKKHILSQIDNTQVDSFQKQQIKPKVASPAPKVQVASQSEEPATADFPDMLNIDG